jgi:hypothetical protein
VCKISPIAPTKGTKCEQEPLHIEVAVRNLPEWANVEGLYADVGGNGNALKRSGVDSTAINRRSSTVDIGL